MFHRLVCNVFFFLVLHSEFYPASQWMDKLLSAAYLISSERDMLQCVQFPTKEIVTSYLAN